QIDKELHLNRQHEPHANNLEEHYCRRWLSISQLKQLADNAQTSGQVEVGVQLSKYTETEEEYFCITIARPAYFPFKKNVSVTIGLLADRQLREQISFLNDPAIPQKKVSVTCERCPISNCAERAAPPVAIQKRGRKTEMEAALERLTKGS
ncbi:MAG: DNA-binding protein, partial [Bacteroidota bacterium]